MAKGDPTAQQAITGYGFQFWYEKLAEGQASASVPDDVEFVEIEGMKSGSLPSPDRPEIDCTTTMDKVKVYLPGTGSINDISLDFNFYPENEVHQDILTNLLYTEETRWWKITGHGMTFIFLGYLKSANTSYAVDQVTSMPLVLKVSSTPIVQFPTTPVTPPSSGEEVGSGGTGSEDTGV